MLVVDDHVLHDATAAWDGHGPPQRPQLHRPQVVPIPAEDSSVLRPLPESDTCRQLSPASTTTLDDLSHAHRRQRLRRNSALTCGFPAGTA
jgi:hypothetical protein